MLSPALQRLRRWPQNPSAFEPLPHLDAEQFSARYRIHAGYMDGGNAYFDCVARVPPAWNRFILYDAGHFHSADIGRCRLTDDPAAARLTLNVFFTCRRSAR